MSCTDEILGKDSACQSGERIGLTSPTISAGQLQT
jgi:hypothetical protein